MYILGNYLHIYKGLALLDIFKVLITYFLNLYEYIYYIK